MERDNIDRRTFLQGVAVAAAVRSVGVRAADAPAAAPAGSVDRAWMAASVQGLYRVEMDVRDCEIEGKIPTDLNGRVLSRGPGCRSIRCATATFPSMAKAMSACSASRTAA